MLEHFIAGAQAVFSLGPLAAIIAGVLGGIAVGALPGLGPAPAVALLLPMTYHMSPTVSLVLLGSVYLSAQYGGSITSIVLGIPGEASSAAMVLDGYPLTCKGQPGLALAISIISSTIGGLIGVSMLILLSKPLMSFALGFGPAEYFALGLFGISVVSSLTGGSLARGLLAACFGLFLATIGLDPLVGYPRFNFGTVNLFSGIDLVPVLLGLFAVSEVFAAADTTFTGKKIPPLSNKLQLPNIHQFRQILRPILQSSVIGVIVGVIPGAGATVASFIAYNETRRFSRRKDEFGHGCLEGIAAPEAASNASVGGALIPLLTLGIPGSATTAILLGALMIQGIRPGQELFTSHASIVYGLFVALLLANFVILAVGLSGARIWIRLARTPEALLMSMVFGLSLMGVYSINESWFDVWMLIAFGFVGYLFKKFRIPVAATVIAFVLEPLIEMSFRRALTISDGSFGIFVTSPMALSLIVLACVTFFYPIVREYRSRGARRKSAESDDQQQYEN